MTLRPSILVLLAAALATAAIARDAQAAKIKVPADFPTISLAVQNAAPGDKILVSKGTYAENVSIPINLDGLQIIGKGAVVLDARPGGVESGSGFRVESANVTIRGITILNPKGGVTGGHGVVGLEDGLKLIDVAVFHASESGINIAGDNASLSDCTVVGTTSLGGVEAIRIIGSGATLNRCTVRNCWRGIRISGQAAQVVKCTVRSLDEGHGISISGADAVVVGNRVSAEDDGVRVDGDAFSISKNKFVAGGDNDACIRVMNGGGTIAKNTCTDSAGKGISVEGSASPVTVTKNQVRRCGSVSSDPGILVGGAGSTVSKNVVQDGGSDGIRVTGDGCLVEKNQVRGNAEDGIDVPGNNTTVDQNIVTGNMAEGIENNGTGTVITDNVAKNNRIDIANDGTIATFTGNTFKTGGDTTPPEIDD